MKKIKDSQRYSIIQKDFKENCFECGRPYNDIHECFGGYNRQNSKDYGLCISLCRACHSRAHLNAKYRRKYEQIGKQSFLKNYGNIEDFRRVFHKYYE